MGGAQAGWQGLADGSPAAGALPCGCRRPCSRPLCDAQSGRKGGHSAGAVRGACRPRALAQLHGLVGVSMTNSTARPGGSHCRVLHHCTLTRRQRPLCRSRRRRCVCLRQINGSRAHPLPHLRRAVAHCGVSPQCVDAGAALHCRPWRNRSHPPAASETAPAAPPRNGPPSPPQPLPDRALRRWTHAGAYWHRRPRQPPPHPRPPRPFPTPPLASTIPRPLPQPPRLISLSTPATSPRHLFAHPPLPRPHPGSSSFIPLIPPFPSRPPRSLVVRPSLSASSS